MKNKGFDKWWEEKGKELSEAYYMTPEILARFAWNAGGLDTIKDIREWRTTTQQ